MGWMAEVGATWDRRLERLVERRAGKVDAACPPLSSPAPPAASAKRPPSACSPTATTCLGFDLEADRADLTTREGNAARGRGRRWSAFGRLDVVVANAGVQHVAPVREFPEDRWDQIIAILLTSPFLLAKHAWDALAARGSGPLHRRRLRPRARRLARTRRPTSSAKHGVLGLVKTLALEGGEAGITATAVCPGYVRTPLVETQIPDQAATHDMSEDEVLEEVILAAARDQAADRAGGGRGRDRVPGRPGRRGVQRRAGDHGPRLERPIELPDRLTELLEHAVARLRPRGRAARADRAAPRARRVRARPGLAGAGRRQLLRRRRARARDLAPGRAPALPRARRRHRAAAGRRARAPARRPRGARRRPARRRGGGRARRRADGLRAPAARHPARRRRRRRRGAARQRRHARRRPRRRPADARRRRAGRPSGRPSPPTPGACSARRCARPPPTRAT